MHPYIGAIFLYILFYFFVYISLAPYLNVVPVYGLSELHMKKKIYIGVAWPYANGSLHLGHIAGCYLPADIFARFNRMIGNDVLMVSGSDEHGTPITITADKEKTTPKAIVDKFNKEHTENMKQFGITFDLFTRTSTENHKEVVQDIFKTLVKNNYAYKKNVESFYCNDCSKFLPDRYIEGKCPFCENDNARGDQCDECGKLLDPQDLENVRCKICGETPEIKTSEHFFLALSKFEPILLDWMKDKKHWKSSVKKFTENWLKNGLKDRAITRDMKWGIPVPLDGFKDKRIYVWFEAVIGYLSASIEWSKKTSDKNKWEYWWKDPKAKHYYFLAKDNIPFHSIIWPSILIGYNKSLVLPYDIPANEYLRLKGEQFSKSRGIAVWVPDIVKNLDVDPVRYYLSINMPENKDTNWLWEDFVTKNNDELVGTYGNFIHRVLTFTQKNFRKIPKQGKLDNLDTKALEKIKDASKEVSESIKNCEFKKGLRSAMNLAQFGNYYFDKKQPWILIKVDKDVCGSVMHICLKIVQALSIFTAPYLPYSSDKIWKILGNKDSIHNCSWEHAYNELIIGTDLEKPQPLFKKLLLQDFKAEPDPFSKMDLRVAKVLDVRDHPQAEKLYMMHIDLGKLGKRVIVAGMKPYYSKEEIKGKNIIIVTNLKPAKIRGITSNGMLLAAEDNEIVSLLDPGDSTPGSEVTVEGISKEPEDILEFEDFKKVNMTIDDKNKAIYNGKIIKSEKGDVVTDKPVKKGSPIH
ncbi:MAG: methionine--tRNA ligase [Thermoplasmatales archaeon]|nr:MAG: methionine--tRNA ligase [Thermoplasmatales archaeon]